MMQLRKEQNDYNQAVTAANNIINQTTSPTMNPDDVNRATTQVNNTKVALDGDENLVAAKQQANNRLDQLDHLNNAQSNSYNHKLRDHLILLQLMVTNKQQNL